MIYFSYAAENREQKTSIQIQGDGDPDGYYVDKYNTWYEIGSVRRQARIQAKRYKVDGKANDGGATSSKGIIDLLRFI